MVGPDIATNAMIERKQVLLCIGIDDLTATATS